jgi:hypothetical protein
LERPVDLIRKEKEKTEGSPLIIRKTAIKHDLSALVYASHPHNPHTALFLI